MFALTSTRRSIRTAFLSISIVSAHTSSDQARRRLRFGPGTERFTMVIGLVLRHLRKGVLAAGAAAALTASALAAAPGPAQAATSGPCDIYAAAGTPCVAAHSTVRALLRRLRRPSVPGQAGVGRQHHEHLPAHRRRLRQRRRADQLLRGHLVHHHRDLRPVRARQQPHHRGAGRQRRAGRRRERGRAAGDWPAATWSTASTWRPASATGTTPPAASPPAAQRRVSTWWPAART